MRMLPLLALPLFLCTLAGPGSAALSPAAAQKWARRLIPLPKEMVIERTVTLPRARVAVAAVGNLGDTERTALAALQAKLGTPGAGTPAFTIAVGRCGVTGRLGDWRVPGAERLRGLKNSDQAYALAPVADKTLALTGLTPQGVAYALTTFTQLLGPVAGDTVEIPLARIVDWPDLAARGEWGGSAARDVEWFAAQKMNVVEEHSSLTVNAAGRGEAICNPPLVERGRLHGVKIVPIITHLDQLGGTGLFEKYPETRGQGAGSVQASGTVVAACLSHPKTAEIIADWMVALAQQEGVSSICLWLGENGARCGCDQCKAKGQFVLETQAAVRAWRLAQARNPKIKLRLLLTQGSYEDNDMVLAEVPDGVEVSYYDGGRTYDSSRDPMIYPLLADYVKQGRWLGCYPQLTASWRIVCPWSGPQFIKYRMNEFVDKGLTNLTGYATPDNRLYDFNVTAAAEWGWNTRGRDEHEFAATWATVRGLKDPDRVADWAVLLGPVGWDVYGSGVPFPHFFGAATNLIRNRQAPVLGKGLFRYFPTPAHLATDAAICDRALKLAESLGDPRLITETKVIQGYVGMLDRLYAMGSLLARPTPPSDAEREQLNRDALAFTAAGMAVSDNLRLWEQACQGQGGSRLLDTIQVTEETVTGVCKALAPMGIRQQAMAYFVQKAGSWKDADFEASEPRTLRFEVTPQIIGAGNYEVTFVYTAGWHGLYMDRVALVAVTGDDTQGGREVAVDKHPGVAAAQNRDHVYTLAVKETAPGQRYFLEVSIRGVRSSDKPENRRGCQGDILLRKVRPANEGLTLSPLGPMAPEELARYGGPKFTTTNVHVAVLMGGYGSEGILGALKGQAGLEVQPLWTVTAKHLAGCQAVIVPQLRNREAFRPEMATLLQKFVRDGGGLIATHDAVGYRGLPALFPEICAGGADKVREEPWMAVADHPVVEGLARNVPLPHSYYDFIGLRPGPQGEVLARSSRTPAVAVLAGPVGKGRYVAVGLVPGLSEQDDAETAPTPAEVTLLRNAARWVAGR